MFKLAPLVCIGTTANLEYTIEALLIYLRVSIDVGYLSAVMLDGNPASTRASIPSVVTYSRTLPRIRFVDVGNTDNLANPQIGIRGTNEAALTSNDSSGASVNGVTGSHNFTKHGPINHGGNTTANAMHRKLVEMVSDRMNPRISSLFIDPTSRSCHLQDPTAKILHSL